METELCAQLQLLAASLILGAGLMALYDLLRLFRILAPHGKLWTGLEDGAYWLLSGCATFLLLFWQNEGSLRWYAVAGVLGGMLLYSAAVSRILLRRLKKVEKCLTIEKEGRRAQKEEKKRRLRAKRMERRKRLREARIAHGKGSGQHGSDQKGSEKEAREGKFE